MSDNFPLSGAVTQTINPWDLGFWIRSWGQQFGFININETNSADPVVERRITTEVAGYGRQLGWISEAVDVLAAHVDRATLTSDERDVLDRVSALVTGVDDVKRTTTVAAADRMIDAVRVLKRRDPDAYQAVAKKFLDAFGELGSPPSPQGNGHLTGG
jgi:hypothetical protein